MTNEFSQTTGEIIFFLKKMLVCFFVFQKKNSENVVKANGRFVKTLNLNLEVFETTASIFADDYLNY